MIDIVFVKNISSKYKKKHGKKHGKKHWRNCQAKASFTVEAAVIVPLILFTIAGGIDLGYKMFQEAKTAIVIEEELANLNPVEIVRNLTMAKDIMDMDRRKN